MSEKVIKTDWGATLKRAASVEDEDFRYALCATFLSRAVARIAASDECMFGSFAVQWFQRNRHDEECAESAKRLLRGLYEGSCAGPILGIIAGIETEDASINPEHVGRACADVARDVTADDLHQAQLRAQEAGIPPDAWVRNRVTDIAYHDEKRLQTLDCMELRALFALAKGEVK